MRKIISCFLPVLIVGDAFGGCPAGYLSVAKRPDTMYRVKCDAGYSDGGEIVTCDQASFDSCYAELTCESERKNLKLSNGGAAFLYGQSGGSPSIGISMPDGKVCYAPLGAGAASNAINISLGGETYHTGALHECLKTGTAATCNQITPGDYAIDYTINCTGDNLLGIALCSNNGGTALTSTREEVSTGDASSDNLYCWCAVISPSVSYYVLYGSLGTANECSKSCATKCSKEIADNVSFRTTLFSTFNN